MLSILKMDKSNNPFMTIMMNTSIVTMIMKNLLGKNIRTQKQWRKKKMTITLIGSRKKIIPEPIIDKFILGYHSSHKTQICLIVKWCYLNILIKLMIETCKISYIFINLQLSLITNKIFFSLKWQPRKAKLPSAKKTPFQYSPLPT